LVANFGSGLLVDLSGRRIVFQIASLIIGAVALLAYRWSVNYLSIAVLVALIGASNNLWHPPAIAYLSSMYPNNRGYALAVHALGANLGDTVAPLVAGALLVVLTWQQTASLAALPIFVITAILFWLLLPRDRVDRLASGRSMPLSEYLSSVKRMVRDRAILGLALMAGFRSIGQNGLYVFLPLYLVHELDLGPLWMGVVMMALQLGGLVAAPIAGAWSDRVGRRPVVLAGLSVTTVMIVFLTLIDNETLFIAGVTFMGFAMYAARPVIHSWMMDLAQPEVAASATSVMFGVQSLFTAIMVAGGGAVADRWGLEAVFYLLALSMLVANVLVYLLRDKGPDNGI